MRIFTLLAILCCAATLSAQTAPDTERCRAALSRPSPDSQTTRVRLRVTPFDTSDRISSHYQSLIGLGIRQFLTASQPLELRTYDAASALDGRGLKETAFASLALRGAYRAMLHRDGRMTRVRAVGGTRDVKFDEALIGALTKLGESHVLPAAEAPAAIFKSDSLDIRIAVSSGEKPVAATDGGDSDEAVTDLMSLRLPKRRVTQAVAPKPRNQAPRYPREFLRPGIEGKVVFEFVVDSTGQPSRPTMQVMSATAPQFIASVLAVLPQFRFEPLFVEGCPVPVLVQMPFQFGINRH